MDQGGRGGLFEAAADRRLNRRADGHVAVPSVDRFDDGPRGFGGAGGAKRPLAHLAKLVVAGVVIPVRGGDPPRRLLALLELDEALALGTLRQVQPKLEEQHSLVREHALEEHHLPQRMVEVARPRAPVHPVEDGLRVPAPHEHGRAASRRQHLPEPVERRALGVFALRLGERVHLHVAWVEPLEQAVHGLASTASVHPPDQHHHAALLLLEQRVLRVEQRLAERGQALVVRFLREGVAQLGGFEHALHVIAVRRPRQRAPRLAGLTSVGSLRSDLVPTAACGQGGRRGR